MERNGSRRVWGTAEVRGEKGRFSTPESCLLKGPGRPGSGADLNVFLGRRRFYPRRTEFQLICAVGGGPLSPSFHRRRTKPQLPWLRFRFTGVVFERSHSFSKNKSFDGAGASDLAHPPLGLVNYGTLSSL